MAIPHALDFAPGRHVDLPGRGRTFIRELPGPPGAETLILLHGWTATGGLNWGTAMPALAQHYRVIAIDHRGHGRGIRSAEHFSLEACADDVTAMMDVVGVDRAILAGYSMGGPIAQLVAQRHPERVSGLVLAATAARFPGTAPVAMPISLAGRALGRVPRQMRATQLPLAGLGAWRLLPPADEMGRHDPQRLLEAGQSLSHFDSRPWLRTLRVPTSVVMTGRDRLVPARYQAEMAAAIPGSRTFVVPGGHLVAGTGGEWVRGLLRAVQDVSRRIQAQQRAGVRDRDVGLGA